MAVTQLHLHLVSDSTGETVHALARACVAQFEACHAVEHIWSLVRTRAQIDRVVLGIEAHPGIVLFSLVNDLREPLQVACRRLQLPAIPVLDPTLAALSGFLGRRPRGLPGRQHLLDHDYFSRIDAMSFALTHDDAEAPWGLADADVVLVGVSRTSKTPTCMYLANRGIKAANVPFVPGIPVPTELLAATKPLIVGLTADPDRLVAIRRTRVSHPASHASSGEYTDDGAVESEVLAARRLFTAQGWPVIDVTRRSIEETAAAILRLLARRHGSDA